MNEIDRYIAAMELTEINYRNEKSCRGANHLKALSGYYKKINEYAIKNPENFTFYTFKSRLDIK